MEGVEEAVAITATNPSSNPPPCATCPSQWWEQAVGQLIGAVRKWHDVVVAEACAGYTDEDRRRERKLLAQRMCELRASLQPTSVATNVGTASARDSRIETAQRRSEARRCAAVAADSAPPAARESLKALFSRIESELRENKRAVEKMSSEHVGSGLRSVATVFDVAVYSARRVQAAVESAEKARDKACAAGRGVLHGRHATCRARCTALRTQWTATQDELRAFVSRLASLTDSVIIRDLAEAMAHAGDILMAADDGGPDAAICEMTVQYFSDRLRDLDAALVEIGDALNHTSGVPTRFSDVDGRAPAGNLARTDGMDELDDLDEMLPDVRRAISGLETGDPAKKARHARLSVDRDDEGRTDNAADDSDSDDSGIVDLTKASALRPYGTVPGHDDRRVEGGATAAVLGRLARKQRSSHRRQRHDAREKRRRAALMSDGKRQRVLADRRKAIAGAIRDLRSWRAKLEQFRQRVTKYADECVELNARDEAIEQTANSHCSAHLCAVATNARRIFNKAMVAATTRFEGDSRRLAANVHRHMTRFARTAWRSVGTGRQMVASGVAPVSTIAALEAYKRQNQAEMRESEAAYTESMGTVRPLSDMIGTMVESAIKTDAQEDSGPLDVIVGED